MSFFILGLCSSVVTDPARGFRTLSPHQCNLYYWRVMTLENTCIALSCSMASLSASFIT